MYACVLKRVLKCVVDVCTLRGSHAGMCWHFGSLGRRVMQLQEEVARRDSHLDLQLLPTSIIAARTHNHAPAAVLFAQRMQYTVHRRTR